MNKLLLLLLALFLLSESGFGQIGEYQQTEKILPKQLIHEKTAKFPSKSFYQRKNEWQHIIDSTWGHGVSTSQKLQLFDKYADLIQTKFTLFYRLNFDWDSLRTFYSSQITDSTSQGGLFQIMSHMAWELRDGHSAAWNIDNVNAPLNPGTPLFIIPSWAIRDVSHFGACLTANNEGEIFVFRTVENHPLGLEPGDVIIGYDGVKWMNIVEELMNALIPIYGASSTNEKARKHDLLISAGMNWHMFNTIDIVKYSSGDTLHLSLEPLLQLNSENLAYAEQMDIPGVTKPDVSKLEQGSYGIIDNSNIGYVYIYEHWIYETPGFRTINQIFQEAITNLSNTDGLIIDLRCNIGGFIENNLDGGLALLLSEKTTEFKHVKRCSTTDLTSLCNYSPSWWVTNFKPDPNTFYQKPIAILIGPKCVSMGEFIAHRFKDLPNGKFFGKTSAGELGVLDGYYGPDANYNGWIYYTQIEESYHPGNEDIYLSGRDFPIDQEVWLTKEDVVKGDDTVVKEALKWINNLAYSYNAKIDKFFTSDNVNITADIKNPNNHTLSIIAEILKNDILVDSLNCTVDENKILTTWSIPGNNEEFFAVTIKTKNIEDSSTHILPNIARFTSAGPVVLDSISFFKTMNYYNVKTFIKNNSANTTISNVSVKLICNDPWALTISPNVKNISDIPPGAIANNNSSFIVKYIDSLFPGYFNFKVEILSDGWTYWNDSTQIIVTNINEEMANIPTEFRLAQNYPNPFNPTTAIKYSIPQQSNVTLKVFDVLGSEIATLVNKSLPKGNYEVEFDGSELTSGIYFYRLQAGDFVETKKMILMK